MSKQTRYQQARRENGTCIICAVPTEPTKKKGAKYPNKAFCPTHEEANRRRVKERYRTKVGVYRPYKTKAKGDSNNV